MITPFYNRGIGWVALTFVFLTISFVFDFWGQKKQIEQHPLADPVFYSTQSVREARLKPETVKEGIQYRCNDCHKNIIPSDVQKEHISAHDNIWLKHGANNYCTSCHSRDNREMLKDINGSHVVFSQSHKTCLQCHGTIYRDWEAGVHGRINGYWAEEKGAKKKLTCVECHDPHDPKFKPMHPSPAPVIQNYSYFIDKISYQEKTLE